MGTRPQAKPVHRDRVWLEQRVGAPHAATTHTTARGAGTTPMPCTSHRLRGTTGRGRVATLTALHPRLATAPASTAHAATGVLDCRCGCWWCLVRWVSVLAGGRPGWGFRRPDPRTHPSTLPRVRRPASSTRRRRPSWSSGAHGRRRLTARERKHVALPTVPTTANATATATAATAVDSTTSAARTGANAVCRDGAAGTTVATGCAPWCA
jgi:hypothetical protein